jgi:hypothetical protein
MTYDYSFNKYAAQQQIGVKNMPNQYGIITKGCLSDEV